MTQSSPTVKQEAKLAEALEIALLFEERAKELSDRGDAFAEKWEKRLREADQIAAKNCDPLEGLGISD